MDISDFARPLTINPQSQPHKQTIILLHGRGSNSTEFGPALLFKPLRAHRSRPHYNGGGGGESGSGSGNNSNGGSSNTNNTNNTSNNNNNSSTNNTNGRSNTNNSPAAAYYHRRGSSITLREALPHAKFIFPTAVSMHAKALDGCAVNQWFDNWPLAPMVAAWNSSSSPSDSAPKDNDTLPIPGLQQTVRFLHHLIQTEIDELGGDASGVVIGGFSQGSAASLIAALLWEGESLGAWVGMSGWMPFSREVQQAAENEAADHNMALLKGVDKLRSILDFPVSSSSSSSSSAPEEDAREVQVPPIEHTPLFMAHGLKDDKAPVILSRMVRSCLEALHLDIQHKEYEYGEHEFSEEALCDVVNFLWEKLRH